MKTESKTKKVKIERKPESGADMEARLMDAFFKHNARSGNPACAKRRKGLNY